MRTRTFILLFVLLAATVGSTNAQHKKRGHQREFDFEVRGGVNMCQIDGDASGNYNKPGFHTGVNTSFPLSDDGSFRFVVELGLTQKGSRINSSSLDRTISLFYVEVPLMLAYDMLDGNKLRAAVGVAPAILARANVKTDGVYDELHSHNYKRMDALPICVSLRYKITDHLGIDVRYYNSMLNIAKENGIGTYRIFRSNKGQFNRLLQAGITIDF